MDIKFIITPSDVATLIFFTVVIVVGLIGVVMKFSKGGISNETIFI